VARIETYRSCFPFFVFFFGSCLSAMQGQKKISFRFFGPATRQGVTRERVPGAAL
jgi:hypothetical protein